MRCSSPFSVSCASTAPIPNPEASVCILNGWEWSGGLSRGAEHRASFNLAQAVAPLLVQSRGSGLWSCRRFELSGVDRVNMCGKKFSVIVDDSNVGPDLLCEARLDKVPELLRF